MALGLVAGCDGRTSGPVTDTCRLFFTLDCRGQGCSPGKVLRSALSTNGVLFSMEPDLWFTRNFLGDPAVRLGADNIWRITATDCVSGKCEVLFTSHPETPYFSDPMTTVVSSDRNAQVPDLLELDGGGWRMFFSMGGGISSAFSVDGITFTLEDGVRLATPVGVPGIADPTVTRRKDGTYVMYFKIISATPDQEVPPYKGTPYYHQLFRATSSDGKNFTNEGVMLVDHASVPAVYTDQRGTVWIYYLDFSPPFPTQDESIAVTYEQSDFSLAVPQRIQFTEPLAAGYWTNNPSPLLLPNP